jgi:hypothetical protein
MWEVNGGRVAEMNSFTSSGYEHRYAMLRGHKFQQALSKEVEDNFKFKTAFL